MQMIMKMKSTGSVMIVGNDTLTQKQERDVLSVVPYFVDIVLTGGAVTVHSRMDWRIKL